MKRKIFEYIIILMMFLVSGTVIFFKVYGAFFTPLFLLLSWIYYKVSKGRVSSYNFYFVGIYVVWVLFNTLFIGTKQNYNTLISYSCFIIGSLFVFSSISVQRFKILYLNICSILAVISLILYSLVELNVLTPYVVTKAGYTYLIYMYHNFGWGELFHRLAGLYWEPGAYQIVLNSCLILFFKEISTFSLSASQITKLAPVVIADFFTQSTAGYIILGIFFIMIFIRNGSRGNVIALLFSLLISGVAVPYIYYSSTVQKKLAQKGYDNTSFEIRYADNLGMIRMISEKPITGYGLLSDEYTRRSRIVGNVTSSNGLLSMTAFMGIPLLLCYLFVMYMSVNKMYGKRTKYVLPMIILLHVTEGFYYFPLAFIFILRYKKYNNNDENINYYRLLQQRKDNRKNAGECCQSNL